MSISYKIIAIILCLLLSLNLSGQEEALSITELDKIVRQLEKGSQVDKSTIQLKNINFGINRADLSAETKQYLNSVAKLLQASSRLSVNINAYADPYSDEFEDRVAEERLEAVKQYLIDGGVQLNQLYTNNFSNQFPIIASDSLNTDANRRVELNIVKEKEVVLEDIIVYKSGIEIKADVKTANTVAVRFKDGSGTERRIDSKRLREVRFANGDILSFEEVPIEKEEEKYRKNKTSDLEKLKALGKINLRGMRLKAPKLFGKNSIIFQSSYNWNSNLGFNYKFRYTKTRIPPLSASIEYGITKFIGVGLVAGYEQWGSKALELWFNYQLIGAQTTFHFNLGPQLDPYIGASVNYRRVILKSDPRLCGGEWQRFEQTVSNDGWGVDPFVGLRYFPKKRLGIVAEIGSNKLSFWRLGLTYLLVEKHFILEKNKPK